MIKKIDLIMSAHTCKMRVVIFVASLSLRVIIKMPQIFSCVKLRDTAALFSDIDLTLTTERLVELFAPMNDRYVDRMSVYLATPSSKSKEFLWNYRNPAQRKEIYLDYYVHNHPTASWVQIAETLRQYGLPRQAAVVENTYIQGINDY